MIAIGNTNITKAYLGQTELANVAIGDELLLSSEPAPLPYDVEIEYLQHDESIVGTPVIDTGIVSRAYLLLEITYRTRYASPQNGSLVRVSSENVGWNNGKSFIFYPMGTANSARRILVQIGNIRDSISYRPNVVVDRDVTFKQIGDGNQFYYDNILYTSDSPTYKTYNSNSNLIIRFNCGFLVKKVALTYNGVCVFDAIPVRVGQVGYMYDKISGRLFGNAGTGDFILGNDV